MRKMRLHSSASSTRSKYDSAKMSRCQSAAMMPIQAKARGTGPGALRASTIAAMTAFATAAPNGTSQSCPMLPCPWCRPGG
jgi:hypothetical protein